MRSRFAILGSGVLGFSVFLACGSTSSTSPSTPDDGGPGVEGGSSGMLPEGSTTEGGDPGAEGGPCSAANCSMAGFACDPADGKCKPDGKGSAVGAACTTTGPGDPACGSAVKNALGQQTTCNDLLNDGFPGGYCSFEPCTTTELCPIGASCGKMGGETESFYKNCKTDADCRTPDYKCQPMDQLFVSGASKTVCHIAALPCVNPADCPSSLPKCTMKVCGK